MARLPVPGKDSGTWGDVLNDYLSQAHKSDGTLKANSVTATQIQDGTITESQLDSAAQTKLNATAPVTSVSSKTGDVTLAKADVGLGNVDNTSDTNKPISTATQTALDEKLSVSDLDTQTATNIQDSGSDTISALQASFVGKGTLTIDVRDIGVVGDGESHLLSATYATLAAAQAAYPAAIALSDEQDWAAMQSAVDAFPGATFLVHSSLHAITNRPIAPSDYSVWILDGTIENIYPRNTPVAFQDRANVFRAGNIHPYILKAGQTGVWTTYALSDISKGARTITVTDPTGLSLVVGDKVIVRSDTNPADTGAAGRVYDFMQINKVVAYNSGTGEVTFELPIGENVGSTATLTGPTLCVNPGGLDVSNGAAVRILDGWNLRGRGKVIGASPFGYKMGMWRCDVRIEADCQDLISGQAAVKSHIEVKGEFTNRCLEVKFAAWESTWIADGTFKPDATITPLTTISIGEQATRNEINVRCFRGPEHTSNVRMFEDYGIASKVCAELHDYSLGGQSEVIGLKSTSHIGQPPSDGSYDFYIRTLGGKTQYILIGTDANGDTISNDADPRRHRWDLNARSDGTAPSYAEQVVRNAGNMIRGNIVGDAVQCAPQGIGIEVPENAPVVVATITGAPTYAANTETLINNYTLTGPKVGDYVEVSLQQIAVPASGNFGDLFATAAVASSGQIRVYIRNRSGTTVVMPTGSAYRIQLAWRRRRV